MASITFVIPSILNPGGGERREEMEAGSIGEAFSKAAEVMGDSFKRKVLEADGTPRQLVNVYINGKNAKFTDGTLSDGDEVYILPAVAGGSADLSREELDRYSRQVMLDEIGYGGQLKLRGARICIAGSGGLGNPVATRLAAMGAGCLRIVDRDIVEASNLHRQTLFDDGDVGSVKVEAAAAKLRRMAPSCRIEELAVSINDGSAREVVEECDVVVDALDSVNARYALNRACIDLGIPLVTGAAVGVTGQVFTVIPGRTACYNCIFPGLDEDSMPTCSIEGVHPSILSVVGGIEVAEAARVVMGREPALSRRILHIDLESMEFTSTAIERVPECPVCGDARQEAEPSKDLVLEELCGRHGGKRTYSITPGGRVDLDVEAVAAAGRERGFAVENLGDLGISLRNEDVSVSIMRRGSAVIVGPGDESGAVSLYRTLVGGEAA